MFFVKRKQKLESKNEKGDNDGNFDNPANHVEFGAYPKPVVGVPGVPTMPPAHMPVMTGMPPAPPSYSSETVPKAEPVMAAQAVAEQQDDGQSPSNADTLAEFLEMLGLTIYLEIFVEEGYDDLDVFKELDDATLIEMGISKKGHRKKLLKYIAELRKIRLTMC